MSFEAYHLKSRKQMIDSPGEKMKLLILSPKEQSGNLPGILWIHGGGYSTGMASLVHFSCGKLLARRYGAVVCSPGYRLSGKAPFPAAFDDCCSALLYMDQNREALGIDRLIVGGESAGGGLAAAVCLWARDRGGPKISLELPIYPMLDCEDTISSRDNRSFPWNTKRNHRGWARYLGSLLETGDIPTYASPAREMNLSDMPPCYTFVTEGEPFYEETKTYVSRLLKFNVKAQIDVYKGSFHAFDMLLFTRKAKMARHKLLEACMPYFTDKE